MKYKVIIHGKNTRFKISIVVVGKYLEDLESFKKFAEKNNYSIDVEVLS